MAWPVDGRGRQAPERSVDAMSEQEFHDRYIETVVQAAVPLFIGVAPPTGVTQAEARLHQATYLKYFSFFAWKFPSWLAAISDRCPFSDVRKTIIEDLVDEEVGDMEAGGRCHIDILYEEAEACGITRAEIAATEATPAIVTCVHAFENLARTLSWQGSFSAIGSLEILQSEPAVQRRNELIPQIATPESLDANRVANIGNSLPERTGLSAEQLVFQSHHAYKDQFHGGGELALILKYGNTKAVQEEMLWAAKASVGVYCIMRAEIERLSFAAIGREVQPRFVLK